MASKDPLFETVSADPHNGGPPLDRLSADVVTPVPLFFVRSHAAVPPVEASSYRLVVDGLVERPLALSLDDLRRFPRREIEATLPCAGNRRRELESVAPVPGELPWGSHAVGNAVWSGVALSDVLREARPTAAAAHVAFEGLDRCEREGRRFGFGGSIPWDKARDGDVLIADVMNGAPLTPEHGFPARALVPGFIGARSVKWLARVEVREAPSESYFQQRAYRIMRPGAPAGPMLGAFDVNAVVTSPRPGDAIAAGIVVVEGVAFAGGGRRVARVEVSPDGGRSWAEARLEARPSRWAWSRFHAAVGVGPGEAEIVVRAQDDDGGVMPERLDDVWNAKGYANNAWYRVRVTVR